MEAQQQLDHPEADSLELTPILHALSDPQRLEIVRALAGDAEPRRCGSFDYLGLAKSTLTHHYRILREAGIIRQERRGTARLITLRRDDLDARFPGLLNAVLAADGAAAPTTASAA